MAISDALSRAMSPRFLEDVRARLRVDGWLNTITGLGGSRDRSTQAAVAGFAPMSLAELDALYHSDDLAHKIVRKLPEDGLRRGWKTGAEELDRSLIRWEAANHALEAWSWGRLFGCGGVFLGLSDRLGPTEEPADLSRVVRGDLRFLLTLDGYELTVATYDRDPCSPTFGEPLHYTITPTGVQGAANLSGRRIHRSRLILFGGAPTAPRVRARNAGRDLSVLQRVQDVLRDTDQSWRSVMCLLQDLSQAVFKINGLVDMIADGQAGVLQSRMEVVNMARSVARAVVVDKDGEDFAHVGAANVTGVDPLLMRVFQRLAGAVDMPMTVLFGMSPAGLNATGESDLRLWYGTVDSGRTQITPQIRTLSRVIARTEGLEPPDEITWPSLYQATEAESADVEQKQATTDQIRITSGIVSPEQVAAVRFGGKRWEDVLALDAEPLVAPDDMIDPTPPPESLPIEAGAVWLDTVDGHRIRVRRVLGEFVYCTDLDGDSRGFAWTRATFLERCEPPAEAPASAVP